MSVATLKQRILNELDNGEKGLSDKIAKLAGYSSGSALRKVLTDDKKEFGKFYGLVKVVQELFPQEEKELMAEYALTVDPNKQTARYMLEYLSLNERKEELNILIDNMLNCTNKESRTWAEMFFIDQQTINKEITTTEALSKFSQLSIKTIDMEVRCEIMKSYSFLDLKDYKMAYEFAFPLQNKIMKIKEEYIKETFLGRCLSILAECEVRKDNTEKAREYCQRILNDIKIADFRIRAYLHFGNSFIMESYEKSVSYLNKGLEIAKDYCDNMIIQLKRSINAASNYWMKETPHIDHISNHPSDLHEYAHSEINKNNLIKAKKILDSIKQEDMSENEKGFHFYLCGLITKEIDDFSLSIIHFKKSNDSHFIKMPILELQKMGINKMLLNALLI